MPHSASELVERVQAERFSLVTLEADPAAGAEAEVTVKGAFLYELRVVHLTLVTGAVAGDRRVELVVDDGNTVFYRHEAQAVQAASLTRRYTFAAGLGYEESVFAGDDLVAGIIPLTLLPGWRVRTVTANLDAGDNYGRPVLYVERTTNRGIAGELAYELAHTLRELGAIEQAEARYRAG